MKLAASVLFVAVSLHAQGNYTAAVCQGSNLLMAVTYTVTSNAPYAQMVIGSDHIQINDSYDGIHWAMVIDSPVPNAGRFVPGTFSLWHSNNIPPRYPILSAPKQRSWLQKLLGMK